jgi:hypothetical protein
MTVRRLLAEVDSRELSEWMAYDSLDPIGDERGDYQAGVVAATLANVWRGKGQKACAPGDFVPRFGAEPPDQETLIEKAKALALALGGEVISERMKDEG